MVCRFTYAAIVLLAFFSSGFCQWQQGVPASKTIRIAVDAGPGQKAPEPGGQVPLATGARTQPTRSQPPTRAQVPVPRRPMANQPAANGLFNQFPPYLFDSDMFQDRE